MPRFECWTDNEPTVAPTHVTEPTPAEAAEAFFKEAILYKYPEVGIEVSVVTEDGEVLRYQVETIITVVSKMLHREET